MLPKLNRLVKQKDIEMVFKKGKGFKDRFLFLKIVKNNLKNSRFGFMVSKKISKKATVRNKIKRTLRESIRPKLGNLKEEIDGVFVASQGLENKNFREVGKMVDKLFERAKLTKK